MNVIQLEAHATQYRAYAAQVWSEATAYPGDYDPAVPAQGQCGVTSIGFGNYLRRVVPQDATILYERGKLYRGDTPVGTNHGWIAVAQGTSVCELDLTHDQFVATDRPVLVSPDRRVTRGLRHIVDNATPIDEYQLTKMADRYKLFAANMGKLLV